MNLSFHLLAGYKDYAFTFTYGTVSTLKNYNNTRGAFEFLGKQGVFDRYNGNRRSTICLLLKFIKAYFPV